MMASRSILSTDLLVAVQVLTEADFEMLDQPAQHLVELGHGLLQPGESGCHGVRPAVP
jgi:hypothetical protein